MNKNNLGRILFPRAFAFAVDDLGWSDGTNDSKNDPPGPVRAGVKRKFDLNDYKHIVAVAKAVGVRVQCLFILSEMDRENVLAKYPTTTHLRSNWDNSANVNDAQIEIINYVLKQSAHMEFGFHGTGHEYWADDGIQRRAEWYNLTDKESWPEESLRGHIQAFKEIMAQYGLTPENGHSFPESFVPCAYGYFWNPEGAYSLGKLLAEAGVKYANTDFGQIPECSPPREVNGGGFDNGTHVINRLNYGNHYHNLNSLPVVPVDMQYTDIIESHWPNWLAADDFLQEEVTNQWINYYQQIQQSANRYIAKNTEQLHSQWLYNKYTIVAEKQPGIVAIDNTKMPDEAYANDMLGNMVLKIQLDTGEFISEAFIDEVLVPAFFEEQGFTFFYLPVLKQKKYSLKYKIENTAMPLQVFNDGTYNVYSLEKRENEIILMVKIYGKQAVKITCSKPMNVVTTAVGLLVESFDYDANLGRLSVIISAANMQGTKGELKLLY